jgi:hypothetical protein
VKVRIEQTKLRKCKTHFTTVCLADVENLGGNAALLWIILCHKWDLANRKPQTREERKGRVIITRKFAHKYGLGKNALLSAIAKLEAKNMVVVSHQPRKSARIKMRESCMVEADQVWDIVPKSAQNCPEICPELSRNPPTIP